MAAETAMSVSRYPVRISWVPRSSWSVEGTGAVVAGLVTEAVVGSFGAEDVDYCGLELVTT